MKKIIINSRNGTKELQRSVDKIKASIPIIKEEFIRQSVDYLYNRAAGYISESTGNGGYVPTGELLAGLKKDYELGRVFNDCAHAAYVEYGVGKVGIGTHENPPTNYQYDVNNHGDAGWVYPSDNGNFYHTDGMVAHRFMYKAIIDYKGEYKKIFNKVFDDTMKEVFG